jgi:hypothetical protein
MKKIIIILLSIVLALSIAACGGNGAADVHEPDEGRIRDIIRPEQGPPPEPEGDPIEILTNNEMLLFNAILDATSYFDDVEGVRITLIENQYDDMLLNRPLVITLATDAEEHKFFFDIDDPTLIFDEDPAVSAATYFGYRYNLERINYAIMFHWEQ